MQIHSSTTQSGANISVRGAISAELEQAFHPLQLEIIDESHLHAGHAGSRPEGETHFRVLIVSETFSGESRVMRQRKIYTALDSLLQTRIHALQLSAFTPEEYENYQKS